VSDMHNCCFITHINSLHSSMRLNPIDI
jgi:hypothetical protein